MKRILPLFFLAAFFLQTTKIFSQVNVSDSLALVDIYNNDNGINWPSYAQWTPGTLVSTWFGVTVTNNRVTGLFGVGSGRLKGVLPASIGNLTALTDLVLDDSLTGSIPSTIGNLVNLNRISFQENQLTGSIPPELGNLTNLTVLLLNYNKLTGSIPATLGNLTKIEDLDFSENQLSDSIPSTLDNFTPSQISLLDFSNNAFTFSGMEGIATAYAGTNTGIDGQAKIPLHLNGTTFSVSAGGTLSNNTYTWVEQIPVVKIVATNVGDSTFTPAVPGTYYVTISNTICSPSPFSLTLTSDTLSLLSLPVTIINFTGAWMKSNTLLQWETGNEINSSYFNIQRSIDGINFSNKGKVAAAGNSRNDKQYSFIDEDVAALNAPNIFYRLQEVDKDGGTTYSKIISLKANVSAAFSVYPNPAKDAVYLNITGETGEALITVIDMNGNKLQTLNKTVQPGNTININTSNLAAGTYFIHININGNETEKEFIKQ